MAAWPAAITWLIRGSIVLLTKQHVSYTHKRACSMLLLSTCYYRLDDIFLPLKTHQTTKEKCLLHQDLIQWCIYGSWRTQTHLLVDLLLAHLAGYRSGVKMHHKLTIIERAFRASGECSLANEYRAVDSIL